MPVSIPFVHDRTDFTGYGNKLLYTVQTDAIDDLRKLTVQLPQHLLADLCAMRR